MKIAFVTGGTGFLGSHLICELLRNNFQVKALKRPESSLNEFNYISALYFGQDNDNFKKNLNWIIGDIQKPTTYEEYIDQNTCVFHCAALVSFNKKDKYRLFESNIQGTAVIADVCLYKKCLKLIYASSTAAVGKAEENEYTDESNLWDEKDNPSNYSVSKYFAELEVWRAIEEGLNAVIVNPSMIIGAGDFNKNTGKFFTNAQNNFPFYATGSNAFVYVKDVVKAMITLALSDIKSERFLLTGSNLSFKDFFDLISKKLNKKKPTIKINRATSELAWRVSSLLSILTFSKNFITKEAAQSSVKNVKYSSNKIETTLGFEFTPIEKALDEIVEAFKNKK
ncbi:MAG: NAD-dependent epimerase/dehydratase family protein [Bacteroidetes bacterium]|nr:NAD-dependent epimerase/dehydratase family protein [Bacteroidota bacterium]